MAPKACKSRNPSGITAFFRIFLFDQVSQERLMKTNLFSMHIIYCDYTSSLNQILR